MIASKDPRCIPVSKNSELIFKFEIFPTKIKWAEELIGRNSVTPWMADKVKISKKFENIEKLFGKLNNNKIKRYDVGIWAMQI